jgi:hypothetical protein
MDKVGGVVGDGFIRVGHLLDNIVEDRFSHQDDSPACNPALKSATGPQVDQQVGLEVINDILRRRRRGYLSPAAMEIGKRLNFEHLPQRR